MNITIGVAIATCNGERFIAEQLNSILSQSTQVDFIAISDDASVDSTIKIAEEILSAAGVEYLIKINNTRLGVLKNFMQAFSMCETDYIAYCDQDDVWNSEKIKLCKNSLSKSEVSLVFHASAIVDVDLRFSGETHPPGFKSGKYTAPYIPDKLWGYGHQYIFSKSVLLVIKELMKYDSSSNVDYLRNMDKSLLYVAGMVGDIVYLAQDLIKFRRHSFTVSNAGKPDARSFAIGNVGKFKMHLEKTHSNEVVNLSHSVNFMVYLDEFLKMKLRNNTCSVLIVDGYRKKIHHILKRSKARLNTYTNESRWSRLFSCFSLLLSGGYGDVAKNRIPVRVFLKDLAIAFMLYKVTE